MMTSAIFTKMSKFKHQSLLRLFNQKVCMAMSREMNKKYSAIVNLIAVATIAQNSY